MAKNSNVTKMGIALAIVCFASNISQLPIFVNLGLSSMLAMATWALFIIYCIGHNIKWKIGSKLLPILFVAILYFIFLCLMEVFTNKAYLASSIIYPFFLSVFILVVAYNVGDFLNGKNDIQLIATAYIAGAILVGGNIFFEYLVNADIADRVYAYDSKNSVAQILLTAFLLLLFYKISNKKIFHKIVSLSLSAFLLITVLLLKSRATIIVIPFLAVFALLLGNQVNKRIRWGIIGLIVAVIVYLILSPNIYDILINDILLGGRESGSLDDISSGRWSEWTNFFADLGDGWFFGNGAIKRESLILSSILSVGIPMGLCIIFVAITPFIYSLANVKCGNKEMRLLFFIAFCYFVNAIFEQQAPFGPGVKCYFLWLIFGIVLAKQNKATSIESLGRRGMILQ